MQKLTLILASAVMATPAIAADLPNFEPVMPVAVVAEPTPWTGFYAGAHAGYAFSAGDSVPDVVITLPGTDAVAGQPEIAAGETITYSYDCGVETNFEACTLTVNGQVRQRGLSRDELRDAVVALGEDEDEFLGSTEGSGTITTTTVIPATQDSPARPARVVDAAALGLDEFEDDEDGFIGGAHIGYDHHFGWLGSSAFILGAVADVSYVDIETLNGFTNGTDTISVGQELDYLATLRLRAGLALGNILAYGTGGVAIGEVETTIDIFGDIASDEETAIGYAVGGGLDALVTGNLSLGVEYLYTDLDNDEFSHSRGVEGRNRYDVTSSDSLDFHTVWVKASYRFN